jgi:membrane-bound inhibitor of C-type lysozyme
MLRGTLRSTHRIATEFAGQALETVKLVSSCSEALAHYECQRRNLEIKTDNERTIPVYEESTTCISKLL